jgi:hypothetical protein
VAVALFGQGLLIVQIGLDRPHAVSPDWYTQADHPQRQAIAALLDELSRWPDLDQLEFLLSNGSDPITRLQVRLDRQVMPLGPVAGSEMTPPPPWAIAGKPNASMSSAVRARAWDNQPHTLAQAWERRSLGAGGV